MEFLRLCKFHTSTCFMAFYDLLVSNVDFEQHLYGQQPSLECPHGSQEDGLGSKSQRDRPV